MKMIAPWFRLGYIIPHLHTDMDAYQFYRVAPEGMMLVTTGLNLPDYSVAGVERELPAFWDRVDLLARKCDRVSLSGVPVASAIGRTKMRQILAEAEERCGLPCDTDLEAHIATLEHFGAKKIALVTRWPEAVNAALTRYLGDAGIEVLVCHSRARSLAENKIASPSADHELALELARAAMRAAPAAEALLMPGGLWFAIYAVRKLEAEFGRPVLLNILSTTWAALDSVRGAMVRRPSARWGRVLGSLA